MSYRIESIEGLRELYREPSSLVKAKVVTSLSPQAANFIERSPFVLVATVGANGRLDVSPRGGPSGFIRVLDPTTVALPDLNGNNLLDTLTAVVEAGRVGMLVVLPGQDETLRLNGRAHVSADPDLLGSFTKELRVPRSAIVVEIEEVFIHCAKAFRRGEVWQPESWSKLTEGPDIVDILCDQLHLEPGEELRARFTEGYATELAADRPDPAG